MNIISTRFNKPSNCSLSFKASARSDLANKGSSRYFLSTDIEDIEPDMRFKMYIENYRQEQEDVKHDLEKISELSIGWLKINQSKDNSEGKHAFKPIDSRRLDSSRRKPNYEIQHPLVARFNTKKETDVEVKNEKILANVSPKDKSAHQLEDYIDDDAIDYVQSTSTDSIRVTHAPSIGGTRLACVVILFLALAASAFAFYNVEKFDFLWPLPQASKKTHYYLFR